MAAPSSFDHNVGLRHLIEPGEDLNATKVRENFHRIQAAANGMVDASVEPGAINTRHLDDLTAVTGATVTDGYYKSFFYDSVTTDFAIPNSSWSERWNCTFGDPTRDVPNIPLFIEIFLEIEDMCWLDGPGATAIDARYWFAMRVITPHSGTVALPEVRDSNLAYIQNPIRSITLSAKNEAQPSNDFYTGYMERQQLVLAAPYIPATPSADMTSLKVSLYTQTTDYAGTGAAAASTAKIKRSTVVVRAIRR